MFEGGNLSIMTTLPVWQQVAVAMQTGLQVTLGITSYEKTEYLFFNYRFDADGVLLR